MSCHAEFLRVAQSNDELPRALLYEPVDALAAHARDPRQRALIELVVLVTREPWALSPEHRARWPLDDDELLHALALAAYFGHLNRIADAVAVPLDYNVAIAAPRADPSAPPLLAAPSPVAAIEPAISLDRRPATAAALAAWRAHIEARPERAPILHWVAEWLGASAASPSAITPIPELRTLAEQVTLAPWRLDDRAFEPLRAHGFDDAALFDVCATASSAGVWTRLDVALRALSA
jgi:alkylhydroperoxidase family enzyme